MQTQTHSKEFHLTEKQEEARGLIASHDNTLLYGGSRSAKTFGIIRTIVIRALAARKSRHAVLRFRFNHVKESVVYDTFPKVMELCFPHITYHLDKSDWFVTLPNGSEIWFGGLDEKERTDKILGKEYVTIFLNEASQISYASYTIVETRLAQVCHYTQGDQIKQMSLKMLIDENPPSTGHWTHKLFIEKKDPLSKRAIENPEDYASLLMNPSDNTENLPSTYIERLKRLPKRQRDRFWAGKFGDETENALWSIDTMDQSRVNGDDLPQMVRVVVSVDPSGADDDENKNNDDIGICVGGLGSDGNGYLFEDLTLNAGPATWGKVAATAYERHKADRVVGEKNFGGAMVEFVVKTADPNISYKAVQASRGKVVRAEPIAALHETGKIKLVGRFDELEDELTGFTTTGYTGEKSPNRADAFVWLFTELFPGMVREDVQVDSSIPAPRRGFR